MKTLERKLIVFFIVALLVLGGLSAVTLIIARQELTNNQLSEQSVERLLLLGNLETTLFEAESSQRAYAVTGGSVFLIEHRVQRERLARLIRELDAALVAGAVAEAGVVRDFTELLRRRIAMMDEMIRAVEAQGVKTAISAIKEGEGKRVMDQIRAASANLRLLEQGQMSERSLMTARHLQQLLIMVPLASGVSIVLFVISVGFSLAATRSNQRLLGELRATGSEIRVINELSSSLQSSEDRDDAAGILNHYLMKLFPQASGGLYLMRPSRNLLELTTSWGASLNGIKEAMAPTDCWALRLGKSYERHSEGELPCHHLSSPDQPSLCVPLMAQGDIVGMVHFESEKMESLGAIKPLAELAGMHISAALAGISLRETLRQQSIRDPLTGLFNRRYLEETLVRELHRAQRNGSQLSVIMLDIDHFKTFNDQYGHQAGDLLLKEFGNNLRAHVRGQDIACRYGGEEFILVLADAGLEGAVRRAESLRQSLVSLVAEHQGEHLPTVTASFGVAVYPQDGEDAEALQRLADRALYFAKANGRDQVAVVSDLQ